MSNHDSQSQDVDGQNGLQHVASLIEENASVIAEFAADKERAVLLTAFCLRLGGFPKGAPIHATTRSNDWRDLPRQDGLASLAEVPDFLEELES